MISSIYGQHVVSDIDLPGFAASIGVADNASVANKQTHLSVGSFPQPDEIQRQYLAPGNRLYRAREPKFDEAIFGTVPHLGSYKLTEDEVILQPIPALPDDFLLSFALGSGLGVQLYLQGIIPMHGMAFLNPDGSASLVFGVSGAGKSTLAAACVSAGLPIFSDDILPVYLQEGKAYIAPAHRRLKLSRELADELDTQFSAGSSHAIERGPAYPGTDKVGWIAPEHSFSQTPARISRCYILRKIRCEAAGNISQAVHPVTAMQTLRRCVYRPKLVPFLELHKAFFDQAHALSSHTQLAYLQLPDRNNHHTFNEYARHIATLLYEHNAGDNGV